MRRVVGVASFAFLISMPATAPAADVQAWRGFRGPVDAGVAAEQLPVSWSPEEHAGWEAELEGEGQSSPVVWGDHVYVTSVSGANKETYHVAAFHLETGEQLWQQDLANATPQESTHYVSKAAPTPVVDESGVVAFFEGGNLIALTHDGDLRWEQNLVDEYGPVAARHGLGSSLAQHAHRVFVWVERQDDPYVAAIDSASGETLWKVAGLGATSWSTPVILTVAGDPQLVISGSGTVRGMSIDDGQTLWTLEGVSGNTTPSPQPAGDGLLLLGATVGRGESGGGRAPESNALVRITRSEDGSFAAEFDWKAERATTSFGSPIVHEGLAYFVNATGVLFCLDLETGEELYAERTPESVWATPLAVGDRVYLVGQKGTTTVVAAGREFRALAENRLWEEQPADAIEDRGGPSAGGDIQYAVAAVRGHLLIRSGRKLYSLSHAE